MAVEVMSWVINFSKAKGTDRLVALILANNANREGNAWPSLETLAYDCRLSRSTVKRSLASLESLGEISIEHREVEGRKTSNKYWFDEYIAKMGGTVQFEPSTVHSYDQGVRSTAMTHPTRASIGQNRQKEKEETQTEFADSKLQQSWEDFQQHRKELGKSITPLARKRLLKVIRNMKTADAIEAVEQSIANGWTGIFPPKGGKNGAGAQPRRNVTERSPEEAAIAAKETTEMEERETR